MWKLDKEQQSEVDRRCKELTGSTTVAGWFPKNMHLFSAESSTLKAVDFLHLSTSGAAAYIFTGMFDSKQGESLYALFEAFRIAGSLVSDCDEDEDDSELQEKVDIISKYKVIWLIVD